MKFFVMALLVASSHVMASPVIIGGEDVDKEPLIEKSTVSLVSKYKGILTSFCSGTVINKSVVVTAAHCLASLSNNELYVSYGKDVRKSGLYEVSKFKYFFAGFFSDFRDGSDRLEGRDIALLITKEELPLTPVDIANPVSLEPGQAVLQAGYGLISEDENRSELDFSAIGFLFMLTENTFISLSERAVDVAERQTYKVAGGDSGGPLYVKKSEKLVLHGVLSQSAYTTTYDGSVGTSVTNVRALYTHPYYFLDWMNCEMPDSMKIRNGSEPMNQVACDNQPFLSISEIAEFNSSQCKAQKPGFDMTEEYGCWPVTADACKSYSEEMWGRKLTWDEVNKSCQLQE